MATAFDRDKILTIDASEVEDDLANLVTNTPEVVAPAIFLVASDIGSQAIRITPKKRGTLRSSQRILKPEIKSGVIQVRITMGGSTSTYAGIVHEAEDEGKKWSTAGTGRKFLEKTLFIRAPDFAEEVAEEVDLNKAVRM